MSARYDRSPNPIIPQYVLTPEETRTPRPEHGRRPFLTRLTEENSRLFQRLESAKSYNWFVPIVFNSLAKKANNRELSDLEAIVIRNFDRAGFPQEARNEIVGKFQELNLELRQQLFPENVARLTINDSYHIAQLHNDLPLIANHVNQHLYRSLNLDHIENQRLFFALDEPQERPEQPEEPEQSGGQSFITSGTVTAGENYRYSFVGTDFNCIKRSVDWGSDDQPYWIWMTISNKPGTPRSSGVSRVCEGVGDMSHHHLYVSETWFWYCGGGRSFEPGEEVATHIELWEHDCGDLATVRAAVDAACNMISDITDLFATSVIASWISVAIVVIGVLVDYILSLMEDDYLTSLTWKYDRGSLDTILREPMTNVDLNHFGGQWLFQSEVDKGRYYLNFSIDRWPEHDPNTLFGIPLE